MKVNFNPRMTEVCYLIAVLPEGFIQSCVCVCVCMHSVCDAEIYE